MTAKQKDLVIIVVSVIIIFALFPLARKIFSNQSISITDTSKIVPENPGAPNVNIATGTELENISYDVTGTQSSSTPLSLSEITATDVFTGQLNAPVKIVVYDNLISPFSVDYYNNLQQVISTYPEQTVIAIRPYYLHDDYALAIVPALALECANQQQAGWEMYGAIMDQIGTSTANINIDTDALVIKTQVDANKFNNCLNNKQTVQSIQAQVDKIADSGVLGTPQTYINGEVVVGARPFDNYVASDGINSEGLKTIIEKQLNK
jgi:protein-disulfide isomerase